MAKIQSDVRKEWLKNRNRRTLTSSPTTLDAVNEVIIVDTSSVVHIITLTDVSNLNSDDGKVVWIYDDSDNAATNNITINANGAGNTINGESSFVIILDGALTKIELMNNNWVAIVGDERLTSFASHDMQLVDVSGPITTTSTTFEDVAGVILTTKDLGENGTYRGEMNADMEHSQNKKITTFRLTIDGTPVGREFIAFSPLNPGDPFPATAVAKGVSILPGVDLQLQWKTESGTAQINHITMDINGVPDSAVKT